MTRVAFLWHMHQPYYEDLVTHEHVLPWVRLHGLKDYYGMVALLREFPTVRMTFNLVPSLLVQLEAFAADRANDRFLEVGSKPATDLTDRDTTFMLQNFFHAHRPRMIDPHPRYAELLAKRGHQPPTPDEAVTVARRFTIDDWRDLQVWQKLAWFDPFYLERDERVMRLLAKQRGFDEEDKRVLRTVELELLNSVIPEYRRAAERGQVELSTSPFYHPILPLLCDTDVYKRTHPDARLPRHRFMRPEDALEQLTRSVEKHERLFGARPLGLWPSEGSVSDDMVPLVAQAGFQWMATDELILARTLSTSFGRDAYGHLEQPQRLYTPYGVHTRGARVACLFRDHTLSDLIGFTYATWGAEAAAGDFIARLEEAGRRHASRTGTEATITVILDGENAWEHFEGQGRPFLRALYRRLAEHPELQTVTMAEAASTGGPALDGIFPGSWIDANFYIWIGHPDDQRAWSQLAEARAALDQVTDGDPAALAQAREEILVAEGSDWCWWYGDDHSSEHDLAFDELYRRHLRNVYRLLGRPAPDELFVSNISRAAPLSEETAPTGLITPCFDGEETSYFEWLGAGCLEVQLLAGAMHQVTRTTPLLTGIHFGFDRDRLYVRLDTTRPARDLVAEGFELSLKFLDPAGVRVSVRRGPDRAAEAAVWARPAGQADWVQQASSGLLVACGTILELGVPLGLLAESGIPGHALEFFVAVYSAEAAELERHPGHRPIEVTVPDQRFEALNWTA